MGRGSQHSEGLELAFTEVRSGLNPPPNTAPKRAKRRVALPSGVFVLEPAERGPRPEIAPTRAPAYFGPRLVTAFAVFFVVDVAVLAVFLETFFDAPVVALETCDLPAGDVLAGDVLAAVRTDAAARPVAPDGDHAGRLAGGRLPR